MNPCPLSRKKRHVQNFGATSSNDEVFQQNPPLLPQFPPGVETTPGSLSLEEENKWSEKFVKEDIVRDLKTIFPAMSKRQTKFILGKLLPPLPINSRFKVDLEKHLLKENEKMVGKDLQSHVESVFSTYSWNDCQLLNRFCQLAVEAKSNLTPEQERSLR